MKVRLIRPKSLPRHLSLVGLFLCLVGLSGCASLGLGSGQEDLEKKPELQTTLKKIEETLTQMESRMGKLEEANQVQARENVENRHQMQESRAHMALLQRRMDTDDRRARSGLSLPLEAQEAKRIQKQEDEPSLLGFDDVAPISAEAESLKNAPLPLPTSPENLTLDALQKMKTAQYGEAVVRLSEVLSKFPNHEDGGEVALALAQCWLKLGEPQNALPALRTLYARFPTSFRIAEGKLTEARAHEKLGAKQKARALYRDLAASFPLEKTGQEARAALARMREEM
jgi:TolA-binding protein